MSGIDELLSNELTEILGRDDVTLVLWREIKAGETFYRATMTRPGRLAYNVRAADVLSLMRQIQAELHANASNHT